MRYLHSQGIVHCNLSPETIHVDWDWNVRVGNFTHSLVSGEDPATGYAWREVRSSYLAPECYDDRFSLASDVFSFGLILYLLIVGRAPFPLGLSLFGVGKRIVINEAVPEIPDSVLPPVRELITDCWAADPDDRPPFREILKRLEAMRFRVTGGVDPSKVASFVQKITEWEAAHGLADLGE
jgi:serine/threonine protein kinase